MKIMEKNRSETAKRSRNNPQVALPSSGNIAHNILNKSESRIHVGGDYQASLPEYNLSQSLDNSAEPRLLWAPSTTVNDVRVEEFLKLAKSLYGYNIEQALGMLFWHKWDFDAALTDMKNFAPIPDEWPVEDKVLFEQAFISHGKNFRKLQSSMPDKSVADLVKYYYLWKCRLLKEKYFRRQHKDIVASEEVMEAASDVNEFSDSDEDVRSDKSDSTKSQPAGATKKRAEKAGRNKDKVAVLPKGIYMDVAEATDMLKTLSSSQPVADLDPAWKHKTDVEQNFMSQQIKANKQNIVNLKGKTVLNIDKFRIKQDPSKISSTWTSDELLLAVQGLRMYGKDFDTIAEVIGTKTEKHVRDFFVTYQRRFNLDDILDEFYKEQRMTAVREDSQMEVEPLDGLALFTQAPPPLVRQAPLPSQSLVSSHLSVSQPPPLIKPDGFLLKPNNHA